MKKLLFLLLTISLTLTAKETDFFYKAEFTGQEILVAGVFDYFKTEEELDIQYEKDYAEYEKDKKRTIKRAKAKTEKEKKMKLQLEAKCANKSGKASNDFAAKKIYESCMAANLLKIPPPKKPKGYDKRKREAQKREADLIREQYQKMLEEEKKIQSDDWWDTNRYTPAEIRRFKKLGIIPEDKNPFKDNPYLQGDIDKTE
jgi:hypothetical protein